MAMFHLDTAFMLELAGFAAGLVLLSRSKHTPEALVRAAGWVLVVGSLLAAACTTYYGIRYHIQGDFDHAYPHAIAPWHGEMKGHRMHRGMMGRGMTEPDGGMIMRERRPKDAPMTPPEEGEHSEHHEGESS